MIELTGHDLTPGKVWEIAQDRGGCQLAASARERMAASRALVEKVAAEPRAVYGINTGFGPLSGTRVAAPDLAQHQLNLLHHLSVGQGRIPEKLTVDRPMFEDIARVNELLRSPVAQREMLPPRPRAP